MKARRLPHCSGYGERLGQVCIQYPGSGKFALHNHPGSKTYPLARARAHLPLQTVPANAAGSRGNDSLQEPAEIRARLHAVAWWYIHNVASAGNETKRASQGDETWQ